METQVRLSVYYLWRDIHYCIPQRILIHPVLKRILNFSALLTFATTDQYTTMQLISQDSGSIWKIHRNLLLVIKSVKISRKFFLFKQFRDVAYIYVYIYVFSSALTEQIILLFCFSSRLFRSPKCSCHI